MWPLDLEDWLKVNNVAGAMVPLDELGTISTAGGQQRGGWRPLHLVNRGILEAPSVFNLADNY